LIHPHTFAERYVSAWNDRDVDRIMLFFDPATEFRSPFAKLFVQTGVLKGTTQLREFCQETLRRRTTMRLELLEVFGGHDAVSMHVRDESDRSTLFTAVFNASDKITLGILCYNKGR